jgi:hypothetical protein
MGPDEMMFFLSIVPDEVLVKIASEEATLYAQSVQSGDDAAIAADTLLTQMIHANLIWRDLDADALDLFNRVNALAPNGGILQNLTYSDYVDFVRESDPSN